MFQEEQQQPQKKQNKSREWKCSLTSSVCWQNRSLSQSLPPPFSKEHGHISIFFILLFCFLSDFWFLGTGEKRRTHLPDGPIANPDDVEESRHHLRQELHTLQAEGFENKGDGLDHHGVVMGQGLVPEDPHEGHHGDCWVELVQGEVSHVNQHLTGAVVSWKGETLHSVLAGHNS